MEIPEAEPLCCLAADGVSIGSAVRRGTRRDSNFMVASGIRQSAPRTSIVPLCFAPPSDESCARRLSGVETLELRSST